MVREISDGLLVGYELEEPIIPSMIGDYLPGVITKMLEGIREFGILS